MSEIKVGSQVEWRRALSNGNLVEIGNVIRLDATLGKAMVDFPTLYKRQLIPLDELTNTDVRFGQIKVQESPARRSLVSLLNQ